MLYCQPLFVPINLVVLGFLFDLVLDHLWTVGTLRIPYRFCFKVASLGRLRPAYIFRHTVFLFLTNMNYCNLDHTVCQLEMVGVQGFEPWTSAPQMQRTTRLCYTP